MVIYSHRNGESLTPGKLGNYWVKLPDPMAVTDDKYVYVIWQYTPDGQNWFDGKGTMPLGVWGPIPTPDDEWEEAHIHVGVSREKAQKLIRQKTGLKYDPVLRYTEFTEAFSSTSGPFGGIGGQAITNFTMQAWYDPDLYSAVVFCGDKIIKVCDIYEFSIWGRYQ